MQILLGISIWKRKRKIMFLDIKSWKKHPHLKLILDPLPSQKESLLDPWPGCHLPWGSKPVPPHFQEELSPLPSSSSLEGCWKQGGKGNALLYFKLHEFGAGLSPPASPTAPPEPRSAQKTTSQKLFPCQTRAQTPQIWAESLQQGAGFSLAQLYLAASSRAQQNPGGISLPVPIKAD